MAFKGVCSMGRYIAAVIFSFAICLSVSVLSSAEIGYNSDEIITAARDLGQKIEMPESKIYDLVANFKQVSTQDDYRQATNGKAVSAVFVYKAAEGGVIYKKMSGGGFVLFKQNGKSSKIKLDSSSVGAQVGGSTEWGLGLVIGLKNPADFGGAYAGRKSNATAINSTKAKGEVFSNATLVESGKAHDIMLILTGRGLSAGTSKSRIMITLEK
jgi:hypothetical protein